MAHVTQLFTHFTDDLQKAITEDKQLIEDSWCQLTRDKQKIQEKGFQLIKEKKTLVDERYKLEREREIFEERLRQLEQERKECRVFSPGPNYSLDASGRKATCTVRLGYYNTILGPEVRPNSIGIIRIVTTGHSGIMIGLAPATIDQSNINNCMSRGYGWYFSCCHQDLFAGCIGVHNKPYTGTNTALPAGSTVGVRMGKDGDISFDINGTDYGTAYTVPIGAGDVYYLAVLMCFSGDTVEIV